MELEKRKKFVEDINDNANNIAEKIMRQYWEQVWSAKIEEKNKFKIIRWWWNSQFNVYYPFVLWLLLYLIREGISDLHIEAKNTESFSIKIRLNKVLRLVNY